MKFKGNSWITVGRAGFSDGEVFSTSIAIDTAGVPYVVYQDSGNASKATVMKFIGNRWITVGSGASEKEAACTKIAVGSSGIPYVIYEDYAHSNKATVKNAQ